MDKIDFVLLWVDGSDKAWLEQKNKYLKREADGLSSDCEANGDCRYQDCGLLKYWFRAVERFAPWVNRVYFVTCGQKPDWLDESNPKLRLVDHREYIPADYLPTFNSNTIEMNLHRIADLSEQFVCFNDDTFLLRSVKPDFFFKKGLPVLSCDLGIPCWINCNNHSRVMVNNSGILRNSLNVEHLVWKNIWKFINVPALGFSRAFRNLLAFSINRTYLVGSFGHLPQPHLKSTFDEIWRTKTFHLDKVSRHRFRTDDCVSQWLVCAWNMISGRFYPANEKRRGRFFMINKNNVEQVCDAIRRQVTPQLCLSDRSSGPEMDLCFQEVSKAFAALLPEKSSFEK